MTEGPAQEKKRILSAGIDLGTTTSCIATAKNKRVIEVIDNGDGDRLTPSVVCYDSEGGSPSVGINAVVKAMICPENFVYEAKRMIGKGFHDPNIQYAMKNWSFEVRQIKGTSSSKNEIDNIGIVVKENGVEKIYEPVQVSASILNYLIESAKQRLDAYPENVVVTVPAYFNDTAKKRTQDAATIAFSGKKDGKGVPVKINTRIMAEPTAAALAYGSILINDGLMKPDTAENIFVFDLGGGTYDVSIVEFTHDPSAGPFGSVKAIDGDNFLGGADFDNVITELIKEKASESIKPVEMSREDQRKLDLRVRQAAIKIKTALSKEVQAQVVINCYAGTQDLLVKVKRGEFERKAKNIFAKLAERCKGVLLSASDITPIYNDQGYLDFRETGAKCNKSESTLLNIIEEAKETISKVIMVGGSSRIPKVQQDLKNFFTTKRASGEDKVKMPLNPDEAVAYGAAYLAHSVSAPADDENGPSLLLIDMVPLNLNVETCGGVATPVVEARTAVPCSKSQIFSTAADHQTQVDIVITQGNRARSNDNHMIGRFQLTGVQDAPRGVPQIEVTFTVDQNNVLTVSACDKSTGSTQKITVTNMTSNLSSEDVEKMIQKAQEHAEADKEFRKAAEARNAFEQAICDVRAQMEKSSLPDGTKKDLLDRCSSEEAWLNSKENHTGDEIRSRMEAFIGETGKLLSGAAGSPNAGNPNYGNPNAGNPDVEEVN